MTIKANKASASPPTGPMLGQRGINITEFSKEFNNLTRIYSDDVLVPVKVVVGRNRSVILNVRPPLTTYLIKKIARIEKGSPEAKHKIIGSIKVADIYKMIISTYKTTDNHFIKKQCKILISTCDSMGVQVVK